MLKRKFRDHTFMTSRKNVQFLHPRSSPPSVCPNGSKLGKPLPSLDVETQATIHPTSPPPSSPLVQIESEVHTIQAMVIHNEKQHVKSSSMSTVLMRLLQIVKNCSQQESPHVFNFYFCSSVLVSQSILIDVSITYHARATHSSLRLKVNLN